MKLNLWRPRVLDVEECQMETRRFEGLFWLRALGTSIQDAVNPKRASGSSTIYRDS